MFEGQIAAKLAEPFFKKDIMKIVKQHALWGSLLMAIPDFGFGVVIYCGVLWHMYYSICDKVGISLSGNVTKLLGCGVVINILVALIMDIVLSAVFFLEPFWMYIQFYLSGKMFVESIKQL